MDERRKLDRRIWRAAEALRAAGFSEFGSTGGDDYDNSLELYDVPNDARLTPDQQRAIKDAGFGQVYVNHVNKWETHYGWHTSFPSEGWRVRYGHKQVPEVKHIEVEAIVPSWPKDWFESGYVRVVQAMSTPGEHNG